MSSTSTEIRIRWDRKAVAELKKIARTDQQRVFNAVDELRSNPLKGKILSADWKGFRRLRVGSYRIIYAFDGQELLVSVIRVAHRSNVYR